MPYVLVHGGGGDRHCWDLLTPLLPVDTYAVDLPGRGATAAELPNVNLSMFADAVAANGTLHPDFATAMFCNDMDEEQRAFTLRCLVPESMGIISEPNDLEGLRYDIPCTYVRLLRDASLTLETQDRMAANIGDVQIVDLDAGHMAMISRPAELAAILEAL